MGSSVVGYLSSSIVTACAIACAAPAAAQTTLTASFTRGAIAEYSNGPNGTDNGRLFSSLNIASVSISQTSQNGSWGGTQGNDTQVTARITFTNGTSTTFQAAINWVKNAGQGNFDWIGLTIPAGATVADGYTLTPGRQKTYILQFSQSSVDLPTLLPNDLDGSANAGAASSAISVNENQTTVTTLAANKAVTWAITGGADANRFSISPAGAITFLRAPDFEVPSDNDGNNTHILTVEATDSNGGKSTQTVTVTVLDVDEVLPVVAAGQTLTYRENRAANTIIGTVAASDNVAVTAFRFAANNAQTSADGYYTNDNAGVVRITAAGVAAGVANNDFEIAPNSFSYAIQARDAAGNWSAPSNVGFEVTDVVENANTPPNISVGQTLSYAENRAANAAVGTVAASDDAGVVAFRFAASGTQTSADGLYTIDSNGVVRITAAGAAFGVANNDFEISPNSFMYDIEAADANGGWSNPTSVAFLVSDLDDTAPVIPVGQSFRYTKNSRLAHLLERLPQVTMSAWSAFALLIPAPS